MAGIVGAYNYGPCASIGMMAVHPQAQRQGIGYILMRSLVKHLDGQGVPLLFLEASAAGQRLYPSLDFEPDGETLRMVRQVEGDGATDLPPAPDGLAARIPVAPRHMWRRSPPSMLPSSAPRAGPCLRRTRKPAAAAVFSRVGRMGW